MQPKSKIRNLFLKIGFVITLALSFNPVDALAEPVVISLPVVEETEWVMESFPLTDLQTKSDLYKDFIPSEGFVFGQELHIALFFRLIHYERLVKVHLSQWSIEHSFQEFIYSFFTKQHLFEPGDDEPFIA